MRVPRRVTKAAMIAAIVVSLSAALPARAQTTTVATRPSASQPSLNGLDQATQELYRATQSHLVRVLVPVRILSDHPLLKWQSQLDPKLRDQIASALARGQSSPGLYVHAGPNLLVPIPGPAAVVHVECAGILLSPRG